ncbi:MAG TPA: hypothetical protein VHX62_14220 [Solirubrobacteraceae bacterium]|jgi:hypothetical protein|nr:hypothetical protein [Solirubrobacteraceae bacterium]
MRPLRSQLSVRIPPVRRPSGEGRSGTDKAPSEPKPPRKRSLNEAAHKLGR